METTVVIGGAGILGRSLEQVLLSRGINVLNLDPLFAEAELCEDDLADGSTPTLCRLRLDATDLEQLVWVRDAISRADTRLAGLVLMAAANAPMDGVRTDYDLLTMDLGVWRRELEVNLTTAFTATQVFGGEMVRNRGGSIVFVASDLGLIGPDQRMYAHFGSSIFKSPAYTTSKHGIIGLSKHVATSWAASSVRSNAIAPGPLNGVADPILVEELEARIPLGRLGDPMAVAECIAFLLSDAASYVTGSVFVADGGRTAW